MNVRKKHSGKWIVAVTNPRGHEMTTLRKRFDDLNKAVAYAKEVNPDRGKTRSTFILKEDA